MPEFKLSTLCPETNTAVPVVLKKNRCPALNSQVAAVQDLVELAILAPEKVDCANSNELVQLFVETLSASNGGQAVVNQARLEPEQSFLLAGERCDEDNDLAFWLGEDYCLFLRTQKLEDGRIIVNTDQLELFCRDIVAKFESSKGDAGDFRGKLIRW